MTGITSSLATYSGQNAAWQLVDLSSAITAYAGATARVVFRYQSGSSFTGDLQLDAISVGPNTYGFESGVDSFETSTTTDGATSSYGSVTSFQALATGTTNGYWNRDTGNTPSSGTGNLGAYAGSYFVYAEVTSTGFPNKYFWLRGPEVVLESSSPTLGFALGREGATIGTLDVYLDITVDPSTPVDVDAEGLSATSALGTPTVSGAASTGATGVQGLVHIGTIEVGIGKTTLVSGVNANGSVGSVQVNAARSVVVPLSGWGRGGWGELGFGEGSLGVQATGVVGTVGFIFGATVSVAGVAGTTVLGNTAVEADGAVEALGNAATGELGSVAVSIEVDVTVTGLEATSALGTAEVDLQLDVPVTGVQALGQVGATVVSASAEVSPVGVSATGQISPVTILLSQRVRVAGIQGTTALGETTETADANAIVTGVQATGQVGTVLVWGEIVPNQNAGWVDVDDSQTSSWSDVDNSQTPNWTDIAA